MPGFSLQGKVLIGPRLSNGLPGVLRWVGNATVFELAQNEDTTSRKESFSGNRLPYRRMSRGRGGELKLSWDEWNTANAAYSLLGATTARAAGAQVTNYALPTGAVVGDSLVLPRKNCTLVLKDSTGSPKTLVVRTNYEYDEFPGTITFTDLTTGGPFVQPFKADYSPNGEKVIGAFKLISTEVYVRLDGINTDDGTRVVCDVFRVRLSPTAQLKLINDDFNDFESLGEVLADPFRQSSDPDGQFYSLTVPGSTA
jgi:hypothetical protein